MSKIEFVRFNKETTPLAPRASSKEPMLSINAGNGMALNRAACVLMGIKDKTAIEFLQHPTDKQEWRLEETDKGFPFRAQKDGTATLMTASIAKSIKESFECPHNWVIRFKVAKDGKMYSLLKMAVIQPKSRG